MLYDERFFNDSEDPLKLLMTRKEIASEQEEYRHDPGNALHIYEENGKLYATLKFDGFKREVPVEMVQ